MTRDDRRVYLTARDLARVKRTDRDRLARFLGLSPFASDHAILQVANRADERPRSRRR